jgi:ornithine carbamoyltransferase
MAGAYLDNGLKGRDFLTISDFTTDEIRLIIDAAHDLKRDLKEGIPHTVLEGEKPGDDLHQALHPDQSFF